VPIKAQDVLPEGAAERLDGSDSGKPRSQGVEIREKDFHHRSGYTVEHGVLESCENLLQFELQLGAVPTFLHDLDGLGWQDQPRG